METIEEKSFEYKENVDLSNICDTKDVRFEIQDAFTAGAEFAQRWVSVEDELPEVGEMVLTKMEKRHGDTWVQNYYSTATRLENQGEWQTVNWVDHSISFGHITHWRPIELK